MSLPCQSLVLHRFFYIYIQGPLKNSIWWYNADLKQGSAETHRNGQWWIGSVLTSFSNLPQHPAGCVRTPSIKRKRWKEWVMARKPSNGCVWTHPVQVHVLNFHFYHPRSLNFKGILTLKLFQTFTHLKNQSVKSNIFIFTKCVPAVTMNGQECNAQYGHSSEGCPAFQ